jgi:hypothetical protein
MQRRDGVFVEAESGRDRWVGIGLVGGKFPLEVCNAIFAKISPPHRRPVIDESTWLALANDSMLTVPGTVPEWTRILDEVMPPPPGPRIVVHRHNDADAAQLATLRNDGWAVLAILPGGGGRVAFDVIVERMEG